MIQFISTNHSITNVLSPDLTILCWLSGDWLFCDSTDVDAEEESVVQMEEMMSEMKYDEDADIDESEDSDLNDESNAWEIRQVGIT